MTPSPPRASELIIRNAEWARRTANIDPGFIGRLESQNPKVLWIGCVDSRVPETTICDCTLGDILTHRNMANIVTPADDSAHAAIEFAVEGLQVQDIVVVGHSLCGGVTEAWRLSRESVVPTDTPVQRWLRPLIALSKELELDQVALEDRARAVQILTKENVKRQVLNVSNHKSVQDAWARGRTLQIHGWLFQMETALLVDVTGPFSDSPIGNL
ncbi:carbonic anhydrase [Mycena metata]|uniref:Carbonic anhydrase n=1 Tax=Mycena metata TaxID=1033252 RepID=A0AAD7JX22_9AGAR|nr:carbonic anhydrase [Mycena metata]